MQQLLPPETIAEIVATWDSACTVQRIEPVTGGYMNRLAIVHTNRGPLVLKLPRHAWLPEKERLLHAQFQAIGVPAPQVLASGELDGTPWLLTECAPGRPWNEVADRLDHEVTRDLYRQLGDIMGRIHNTTFTAFGDIWAEGGGLVAGPVRELAGVGPFARWVELHDVFVEARLAAIAETSLADVGPAVREFLAAHRHLIEGDITPRLLHLDLHQGNIMVEAGKITAILDGEESIVGHREYDLMRTDLAHFRRTPASWESAYRLAYTDHLPFAPDLAIRSRFYEVSRCLVWICSLAAPGRVGQDRRATEAHIRRYLHDLIAA